VTYGSDLKAGADGPCSNSLYMTAIVNFNTLKQPLREQTVRPAGLAFSPSLEHVVSDFRGVKTAATIKAKCRAQHRTNGEPGRLERAWANSRVTRV